MYATLLLALTTLGFGAQDKWETKYWHDRYDTLAKALLAKDFKTLDKSLSDGYYVSDRGKTHHSKTYFDNEKTIQHAANGIRATVKITDIHIEKGSVYVTADWQYTIDMKTHVGENRSIAKGHEVRTDVWSKPSANWALFTTKIKSSTYMIGRMPRTNSATKD